MDGIFGELGKQDLGIEHLSSLHRDKKCEVNERRFRCEASASKAAIKIDSDHQIDLDIKLILWGKIRRGRIVKVRMEDAQVDVKKMPEGLSMRRSRALRRVERELKRRFFRMAIATRRMSRRMLPIEVKV